MKPLIIFTFAAFSTQSGTPESRVYRKISAQNNEEEEGEVARSNFSSAGLFSLIRSAVKRRALCNIFSAHMADCVTAKHTRGVVAAAAGCSVQAMAV